MSKKPIIGGIILAAIIGLVVAGAQINPEYGEEEKHSESEVWSTRIVGGEDKGGTHVYGGVKLEGGTYKFGFVPMGDSPYRITILVKGESHDGVYWIEKFVLEKSLVDTGISKYYTWDYIGQKYIQIPESEEEIEYTITVKRSGNLQGSVSINLEKVDTSI